MQTSGTPSSVWQRRTHRLVAAAIIIIGLTMMISNISQCIYMGMVFIMVALVWLAWMTMKERKIEPPRPQSHQSPVLFLVASHMLPSMNRSNAANALDKPPSYDTIVSLDGLPPDYSSVQLEKPPRYEEVAALYKAAMNSQCSTHEATAGPSGLGRWEKADLAGEGTSASMEVNNKHLALTDACGIGSSASGTDDGHHSAAAAASRSSQLNFDTKNRRDNVTENEHLKDSSVDGKVQNVELDKTERSGLRLSRLQPKRSSLSRSFRTRRDSQKENRERKRNASGNDSRNSKAPDAESMNPTKSLLRLQVPTLYQDTARSVSKYLEGSDTANSSLPSTHSPRFTPRRSRTLPSRGVAPTESEAAASPADRTHDQVPRDDEAVSATEASSSDARQLSHSSSNI